MITSRLYYQDAYLTSFRAHVVQRSPDGCRLWLDRTAFYPTSGGQPHDTGAIGGIPVLDVVEEGERIAHITAAPVSGEAVDCSIDWPRRFDHMQQHSGQHLLSAVLAQMFGWATVGFHLGAESSTIDVDAAAPEAARIEAAERRVNELVFENRPIRVSFEAAEEALGLRKPSERGGLLRIVTIEGLDRSACGGTHVRTTAEVGPVLIRKSEKIRGETRLEFLCGMRAVQRARSDFAALSRIAKGLSAPLDEAPQLVEAQRRAWVESEKALRRARVELARREGAELYRATPPGPDGFRRAIQRIGEGALSEELRALAQGFTAQQRAIFAAAATHPPSILLAVSADSGLHAGDLLKEALAQQGGRGGGSAAVAQGSLPSGEPLESILDRIARIP